LCAASLIGILRKSDYHLLLKIITHTAIQSLYLKGSSFAFNISYFEWDWLEINLLFIHSFWQTHLAKNHYPS